MNLKDILREKKNIKKQNEETLRKTNELDDKIQEYFQSNLKDIFKNTKMTFDQCTVHESYNSCIDLVSFSIKGDLGKIKSFFKDLGTLNISFKFDSYNACVFRDYNEKITIDFYNNEVEKSWLEQNVELKNLEFLNKINDFFKENGIDFVMQGKNLYLNKLKEQVKKAQIIIKEKEKVNNKNENSFNNLIKKIFSE